MNTSKIALDKIAQIIAPARSAIKGIEPAQANAVDRLKVSTQAQEASSLLNLVKSLPEVREDVIALASDKLTDKKTNVTGSDLAERLLGGAGGQS